jgi:hypothetical protein
MHQKKRQRAMRKLVSARETSRPKRRRKPFEYEAPDKLTLLTTSFFHELVRRAAMAPDRPLDLDDLEQAAKAGLRAAGASEAEVESFEVPRKTETE